MKPPDEFTDLARWLKTAQEDPPWDARVQLIAKIIPEGSTVLDVGAGAMTLERYLPVGCEYTPMDIVYTADRTLYADFNSRNVPTLRTCYDYVVCSGVLEYITEVDLFMASVCAWGRRIIISYAAAQGATPDEMRGRIAMGWLTHMTLEDLSKLFAKYNLGVLRTLSWQGQQICVLEDVKHGRTRMLGTADVYAL